ncbi:hypothetical protein [Pseudomonas aeruginosa]|uniref:hypothetical protein n=1 Tax=Pseudomonas aeruginosa TaxID=287 RepID=UPI003CFC6CB6
MTAPLHLDSLFPSLDAIPEQYRPDAPIEQRDYLVDGQLRHWDGPLAPVRSPVFLAEAGRRAPGDPRQHPAARRRRRARRARRRG